MLVALVVCFFIGRAVWRALAGVTNSSPMVSLTERAGRPIGPEQISLWAAISGVVLPALLLIGGIVLSSRVSIPDGFVAACFLLGVGLELVAVGCGIVSRSTKSGKAGLIIGSIALVLWLATLWVIPTRVGMDEHQPESIMESGPGTPDSGN